MNIREFAESQLTKWGCVGWTFGYNNRSSYGVCKYREKRIELSLRWAETANMKDIRETILHEIAHILAGKEGDLGHGDTWRKWASVLGCPDKACSTLSGELPEGKWKAECPGCKQVYRRHKIPKYKPGAYHYCLKCGKDKGRLSYESSN